MNYCIVYISSTLLSEVELTQIMERSTINNRSLGITGVLLYFNGSVIEVLEGEKDKVVSLYETISRDPRHSQLIQLYAHSVERRSFPGWFVGYKTLSKVEFDQVKGLIPIIEKPLETMQMKDNLIMGLVQIFYQNNYRN